MRGLRMKPPKTLPRVPEDDHVRRLLQACRGTFEGRRNRALVALLADSGLRRQGRPDLEHVVRERQKSRNRTPRPSAGALLWPTGGLGGPSRSPLVGDLGPTGRRPPAAQSPHLGILTQERDSTPWRVRSTSETTSTRISVVASYHIRTSRTWNGTD